MRALLMEMHRSPPHSAAQSEPENRRSVSQAGVLGKPPSVTLSPGTSTLATSGISISPIDGVPISSVTGNLGEKGRERHALQLFDEMPQSKGLCSVGRTVAALTSIRDKGGGIKTHRDCNVSLMLTEGLSSATLAPAPPTPVAQSEPGNTGSTIPSESSLGSPRQNTQPVSSRAGVLGKPPTSVLSPCSTTLAISGISTHSIEGVSANSISGSNKNFTYRELGHNEVILGLKNDVFPHLNDAPLESLNTGADLSSVALTQPCATTIVGLNIIRPSSVGGTFVMDKDVFVGNSLVDFYANCGGLGFAVSVFGAMRERDVVSWTALVSAYMNAGPCEEAMEVFSSMKVNGVKRDLISWNVIVSGFAQNGEIDLALQYLEAMQEEGVRPRVNSWNEVISGCIQNKCFEDALDAFYKMLYFPEEPNFVTIASILSACAGLKDLNLGRAIHGFILKRQLCGNTHVDGSLVGMYSKCRMKDYAEKVFSMAETKSIGLWNELIAAYVNAGETEKGIELLRVMHHHGLKPDVVSYNTILAGHARNGQKNEAYELLHEMVRMDMKPNTISFNVLISSFQQFGLSFEALRLFWTMQSPSDGCLADVVLPESIQPNSITIAGALAACADLSLLSQGKEIHGYTVRCGFEPNVYISSALVDMYSKCLDIVSAMEVLGELRAETQSVGML